MAFLMATNLESAYHLCQLAHPLLRAAGGSGGSVVLVSSVCGVVADGGMTVHGLYAPADD